MTRFPAFLALLTAMLPATAQERHFLYLQADNGQAFYIRVAGETRSSTSEGYLILPRLADSTLEFVIGFPMRKYPEYGFRVAGIDRDRGFALKDFGERGWGLFDMQSMEVSLGEPVSKADAGMKPVPIVAVRDSFATILASVVGDSAMLDASLIVKRSELGPVRTHMTAGLPDSGMAGPGSSAAPGRAADSAIAGDVGADRKTPVLSPSPDADTAAVSGKPGADSVMSPPASASTRPSGSTDTVRMSLPEPLPDRPGAALGEDSLPARIPNPSITPLRSDSAAVTRNGKPTLAETPSSEPIASGSPALAAPRPSYPGATRKLLEQSDSSGWQIVFSDRNEREGVDTVSVWIPSAGYLPSGVAGNGAARPERTDCQGMVSVGELGQLRRRMEAIPDEDAKVAAALREFRQRCFTTEQVRSLLVVFFREEGRYKLLDAAYPRIYDPQTFLTLEPLLKDPYFIHRFRKLVGLQ